MEQRLTISCGGLETPCLLREPEFGALRRVVLGLHGFGGSKDDPIQESIAEELELFGSVILRFDLPGHGENQEDVMSLQNCVDTLLSVAEYAHDRYPMLEDLCIFATDFGAYVALTAMQELLELPCRVRLVIHTPSLQMDQAVLTMASVSQVTLEAMEWAVVKAPRPVGITYSFFEELRENPALAAYPIPFLILCGERDDLICKPDVQQLHDMNQRSKLVIIPGAGHEFREYGALDMVLDLTRDWFEFEQVLLENTI